MRSLLFLRDLMSQSPESTNLTPMVARYGAAFLDGLLALFIGVYGILLGSLGVLKGPLKLDRFLLYIRVLAPKGLLSDAIRSSIEWRLGHFGDAIMKLEDIIASFESKASERGRVAREHVILIDFYTLLTRCYLHTGRVDEAMAVVVRAINMVVGVAVLAAAVAAAVVAEMVVALKAALVSIQEVVI
jgi:hypothetical protein